MIGSAGKYETTYGYSLNAAPNYKNLSGPWAAFWMQSPKISYDDPAEFGAEIDIFEYFNEMGKDTLQHAVHWAYGPDMQSVGPMKSGLVGLDKGFHTFWT